jgi:hypothetical protein
MRLITIIILILSKMSFAQYIQNEQKDKFFLELIQKSNNEKITTLFYNNNVHGIELWDSKKYEKNNKQIINKEQLDPSDSLRALAYISSNKKMKTTDSMI